MPKEDTSQQANLENIAALSMGASNPGKEFVISYVKIMKQLTKMLYKLSKTNPRFLNTATLIDANAAVLENTVKTKIGIQNIAQISGNISSTLLKMQSSKESSFHAGYAQEFAGLQAEVKQRMMEYAKLEENTGEYINKLHTTIKTLNEDMGKVK